VADAVEARPSSPCRSLKVPQVRIHATMVPEVAIKASAQHPFTTTTSSADVARVITQHYCTTASQLRWEKGRHPGGWRYRNGTMALCLN
jgi:hypothetical protein